MSEHFKIVCKNCDKIIRQCRCISEKVTGYELCDECLRVLKEEMENIKTIPVYCAWCKKHSTEWNPRMESPRGDYKTASHGMCPDCYERVSKEWKARNGKTVKESMMSFEEFLMECVK